MVGLQPRQHLPLPLLCTLASPGATKITAPLHSLLLLSCQTRALGLLQIATLKLEGYAAMLFKGAKNGKK